MRPFSGVITTTAKLDFENSDTNFALDFIAVDACDCKNSDVQRVVVHVLDANDLNPIFLRAVEKARQTLALPYYPFPSGKIHTGGNIWSFTVG